MATPLAHTRSDTDDAELARRAAAGDGRAFAELYDRHERRVYGFCLRMLGSPHDAADATQEAFVRVLARLPALAGRELNPVAYVLAAARNACYDAIEARGRTRPLADGDGPVGAEPMPRDAELTRDPERSAMLEASREQVRAANAQLPARQREVLILREVERLSYEEIGELIGLNRNAVAQLISRARIGLRALVRGGALVSVAPAGADCERALPLLAAVQDGEVGDAGELSWLREHLSACETCRAGRAAMQEAGVSYRLLVPVVPLLWLRHATIARAAEHVGADWSAVAGPAPAGRPRTGDGSRSRDGSGDGSSNGNGAGEGSSYGDGSGDGSHAGGPPGAVAGANLVDTVEASASGPRRRSALVAGGALLLLCLLLLVLVGITRDGRVLAPSAARLPVGASRVGQRALPARRPAAARRVPASSIPPPSAAGTPATVTVAGTPASAVGKRVGARRVASTRRRGPKHVAATHHPAKPHVKPPAPQPTPTPTTTTPVPSPPTTTTTPTTSTPTTPSPPPPPPTETPGRPPSEPPPPGFVP